MFHIFFSFYLCNHLPQWTNCLILNDLLANEQQMVNGSGIKIPSCGMPPFSKALSYIVSP